MMTPKMLARTLPEAKAILAKLAPNEPPPKTLARARDRIEELRKRAPASNGGNHSLPAPMPAPAPNLFDRATAIAAKYPSSARRTDPENMSAEQIAVQIEATKDPAKRMEFFRELNEREAGKPRKSIAEQARTLTDLELEQRIESTKDPTERGELFRMLIERNRKR